LKKIILFIWFNKFVIKMAQTRKTTSRKQSSNTLVKKTPNKKSPKPLLKKSPKIPKGSGQINEHYNFKNRIVYNSPTLNILFPRDFSKCVSFFDLILMDKAFAHFEFWGSTLHSSNLRRQGLEGIVTMLSTGLKDSISHLLTPAAVARQIYKQSGPVGTGKSIFKGFHMIANPEFVKQLGTVVGLTHSLRLYSKVISKSYKNLSAARVAKDWVKTAFKGLDVLSSCALIILLVISHFPIHPIPQTQLQAIHWAMSVLKHVINIFFRDIWKREWDAKLKERIFCYKSLKN
jgi:hypothetical protein